MSDCERAQNIRAFRLAEAPMVKDIVEKIVLFRKN
jgi:hypothetical protein